MNNFNLNAYIDIPYCQYVKFEQFSTALVGRQAKQIGKYSHLNRKLNTTQCKKVSQGDGRVAKCNCRRPSSQGAVHLQSKVTSETVGDPRGAILGALFAWADKELIRALKGNTRWRALILQLLKLSLTLIHKKRYGTI